MMFFELDEGGTTLQDATRITQGLLHNKYVLSQLTPEQYADLAYIVTPTLASDHNETNILQRWQKVLAEFSINDAHGKMMRFYQDGKRLFFGDEEGWKEAQEFADAKHKSTLDESLHPTHKSQ